jgi:hypothetical protein
MGKFILDGERDMKCGSNLAEDCGRSLLWAYKFRLCLNCFQDSFTYNGRIHRRWGRMWGRSLYQKLFLVNDLSLLSLCNLNIIRHSKITISPTHADLYTYINA